MREEWPLQGEKEVPPEKKSFLGEKKGGEKIYEVTRTYEGGERWINGGRNLEANCQAERRPSRKKKDVKRGGRRKKKIIVEKKGTTLN